MRGVSNKHCLLTFFIVFILANSVGLDDIVLSLNCVDPDEIVFILATSTSVDPYEMWLFAAFHLGLHSFLNYGFTGFKYKTF